MSDFLTKADWGLYAKALRHYRIHLTRTWAGANQPARTGPAPAAVAARAPRPQGIPVIRLVLLPLAYATYRAIRVLRTPYQLR